MTYYLYHRIPGYHSGYTVAILATSRHDADQWRKLRWRGAHYMMERNEGEIKADIGDITDNAQSILHQRLEDDWADYLKEKGAHNA